MNSDELITNITSQIHIIRGTKIILDKDLAALYGTPVKRLNEQVKRNMARFPAAFMFQLTNTEFQSLRSQFATANISSMSRSQPFAFTEHGALMVSSILNLSRLLKLASRSSRPSFNFEKVSLIRNGLCKRLTHLSNNKT